MNNNTSASPKQSTTSDKLDNKTDSENKTEITLLDIDYLNKVIGKFKTMLNDHLKKGYITELDDVYEMGSGIKYLETASKNLNICQNILVNQAKSKEENKQSSTSTSTTTSTST